MSGRTFSLAYWLTVVACEWIELRRSSRFFNKLTSSGLWLFEWLDDDIVELDTTDAVAAVAVVTVNLILLLMDADEVNVSTIVTPSVDSWDDDEVASFEFIPDCLLVLMLAASYSQNVLSDFRCFDCRSEGAIVPFLVSLHWNNSWTRKLLLSKTKNNFLFWLFD